MKTHALVYHGKYELNRSRLAAGTRTMRLKDGTTKPLPVTRADGIHFGYMTRGKSDFVLVKAGDVLLDTPVPILPRRHTDGKVPAPSPSTFGRRSAANLLRDAIIANPQVRQSLEALYVVIGIGVPNAGNGPAGEGAESVPDIDLDLRDGREGAIRLRTHLVRERDRGLVRRKRNAVMRELGSLKCEICEFDFAIVYPVIGEGFCEVHHKVPLASLEVEHDISLNDLAIVCSNCHRMLHTGPTLRTIDELRLVMDGSIANR